MINFLPDKSFRNLKKLIELDLSHNDLQHIWSDTFLGLYNLQKLYLSRNKISILQDGLFKAHHYLRYISLDHNGMISLKYCALPPPPFTVSAVGNELKCDCALSYLASEEQNAGMRVYGNCAMPEPLTSVQDPDIYAGCKTVAETCVV